jgi:hypothetical protein
MPKKKGHPKGKPNNRYTAKQKELYRSNYEVHGLSCAEISKKYEIPKETIEKWAREQKWQKGKDYDIFHKTQAQKNIEMFAELGVTPKDFAERVKSGALQDQIALRDLRKHTKEILQDAGITAEPQVNKIATALIELFKECGDTSGKCLGWVQEAHKLMGLHAPQKRELTGPDGGPIGIAKFADVPEKELNKRIIEHVKRLGLFK